MLLATTPTDWGARVRMSAEVPRPSGDITRVEVNQGSSGVFLYLYGRSEENPRLGEEWYESLASARDACRRRFGIEIADWDSAD